MVWMIFKRCPEINSVSAKWVIWLLKSIQTSKITGHLGGHYIDCFHTKYNKWPGQ